MMGNAYLISNLEQLLSCPNNQHLSSLFESSSFTYLWLRLVVYSTTPFFSMV